METTDNQTAVSLRDITRVAIVGCGVIGASWAAFYLARGFDVLAPDPAPMRKDACAI
jgi:3-hydroxyacyl-CoA dehydrogenase